jgi:hypothetical protein
VDQLAKSDCAEGARLVIEKPFGNHLDSALELDLVLLGTFEEKEIFRIDHFLGKRPIRNLVFFRFVNALLRREDFLHLALPMAEHDEEAWGRRLHLPLQLALGKVTTAERGRFV